MEITTKEIILRIILALIIGGAIGYEREVKNRAAGFRTHILVCLGSTIISLLQIEIGNNVIQMIELNPTLGEVIKVDYGRLGSQVITGVGFIGAGTIVHTKGNIKGLTTAATLWIVACLGLSIGMGSYCISIFSTIIIFIILVFLKKIENKFISINTIKILEINFKFNDNNKMEIINFFQRKKIVIKSIEYFFKENENKEVNVKYIIYKPRYINLDKIIEELENKKYIKSVKIIK